jgi:plasmid stabilization system protein ParE
MADPLSIAGSVVGITAAGVQASIKLYALAEKVATASQRVTSIADDISSTCAILNQVRELIIPQPDAQGTLKSVFNSVALNDISRALRRCRSIFSAIETLLRRAFEQVGNRPSLHSNIVLSRYDKAKWPFLQPQFDELRNDLRDAKGKETLF